MLIPPHELPTIPASLPVFRTIRPDWTLERAAQFAKRIGVDAPAKAVEPWYVCRTDAAVVEIYQATHSARLTRATFDLEGAPGSPGQMPSDEAAIERADRFIEGLREIHRSQPLRPTLSRIKATSQAPGRPPNSSRTVAIQVNYHFTLDELPLLGPGAKGQATIGASGEIEQAYLFWRQTERTAQRWTTRPAAAALAALAESPHFARAIRTKDVEARHVQFGWLCLPPTLVQETLFPVFEIRGRVTVEDDTRLNFNVFVAAARRPQPPGVPGPSDRWPPIVIA
jgi:hypothetical protein